MNSSLTDYCWRTAVRSAVCALFLLLLVWLCCAQRPGTTVDRKAFVGKPALDFSVMDLEGQTLLLSSLKGKVVYIEFWTTYHTECVQRMQEVQRLYETTDRQQLVILPVTAEGNLAAADFLRAHKLTVPIFLDPSGAAHAAYWVYAMPLAVVVDKSGTVLEYVPPHGDFSMVTDALRKAGVAIASKARGSSS